MKTSLFIIAITLFAVPANANEAKQPHHSKYAGQENRMIKSLSDDDIKKLRNGGGWGLAKAAELNGVPGPTHLLELKHQVALRDDQVVAIEASFREMKSQAISYGEKLIDLEKQLGHLFRSGSVNHATLRVALGEIATTRMELRYVHLSSHLDMLAIISQDQIKKYNEIQGYSIQHQ